LPVIVVTTEDEANRAAEALANGADDYVVKPDFKAAAAKAWAQIERNRRG
jgi:DNA-binding response OmpR family regulator